jgi:transposase
MNAPDYQVQVDAATRAQHAHQRVVLHNKAERALRVRTRRAGATQDNCIRCDQLCPDLALPAFEQAPLRRNASKLSAKLSGRFAMLGMPKIQERLKSRRHANPSRFTTHTVLEAGTTKICIECGERNPRVGGSRKFVCPTCHWQGVRDLDASAQILRADIDIRQRTYNYIRDNKAAFSNQIQRHVRHGSARGSTIRHP